ncbi:hypothetical protein E1B28_006174 [Marasmius oreades]|uniref:Uncharacterized protein n=1 Tax=Marasmius oreades TaxID=181124 RepID=A0A9P7S5A9_9AGAR|nr:uncharacterized protein E1B28_006174 [Marasmius oreades]KAG7095425.1 hypothetical protein E1B28_006174 [Marasmius oreades]
MAELSHPRIPTVKLDVPVITDSIAARLAKILFNHVLFLKSQIPLPVLILHKQRLTNTKADRPRLELLDTLDILSSHLDTTFTALSTAYARCEGECWNPSDDTNISHNDTKSSRATYLAILIGPSISTAKAKVILGVDGLEEKLWGMRDDSVLRYERAEDQGDDLEDDNDEESSEEAENSGEEGPEISDSDSEDEGEATENEGEEEEDIPQASPQSSSQMQPHEPLSHSAQPRKIQTYADLQLILQKADRLLSNTLARAEGEGRGMSCEMALTQTNILLRAPRRFKHPAWIPRQNMGRVMERVVREFEEARGVQDTPEEVTTQNGRKKKGRTADKAKVEGVWVTSSSYGATDPSSNNITTANGKHDEDELNEMIWWSWEREVVGFN